LSGRTSFKNIEWINSIFSMAKSNWGAFSPVKVTCCRRNLTPLSVLLKLESQVLILLSLANTTHLGSRWTGGNSHSAIIPVRRSTISSFSFPSTSCTSSYCPICWLYWVLAFKCRPSSWYIIWNFPVNIWRNTCLIKCTQVLLVVCSFICPLR
jgi:hypothetical protein